MNEREMNKESDTHHNEAPKQPSAAFAMTNQATSSDRRDSIPDSTGPSSSDEGTDRGRDDQTEEKKMKRVLANRRSARESYQRRKKMFSDLESAVTTLTKENAELVEENKKLRCQVLNLHQQLGLTLLPGNQINGSLGVGMGANSLALHQLAAVQQQQQQQQQGHQAAVPQLQQHGLGQQHLGQQQGDLDQLLELILRGRNPST
jgi:hypothetical protein